MTADRSNYMSPSSGSERDEGNRNQGEGNKEAAARFNDAERRFVESAPGKEKIREGTHVSPTEEPELTEAEQVAKARAKAQDSNRM